jgi:hypothetical protein
VCVCVCVCVWDGILLEKNSEHLEQEKLNCLLINVFFSYRNVGF